MREQIQEVFDIFGEELFPTICSPVNKNLFTTYYDISSELDEHKSEIFHSVTAKLLFVMKRGRPDIETVISYLMTRVIKSNKKECLGRCIACSTCKHARTYRMDNIHGYWDVTLQIFEAEIKYEKHNGIRSGWSEQILAL
mmetsp:Transcript_5191/g.7529  ORF Transcript_5191/g.7529 Transcript_5191/m.7529 type:complete len:140 (+) Transcript_5191:410-829(+)